MSFADAVGYEGDREKGLKLLSECQQGASFNAPFAALLMLVYYLTIAPLTGDEIPGGMEHAKRLLDVSPAPLQPLSLTHHHPPSSDSALALTFVPPPLSLSICLSLSLLGQWGNVHYPNGAFFALMESRYFRSICETRKAIEVANKAKNALGDASDKTSADLIGLFHYQNVATHHTASPYTHTGTAASQHRRTGGRLRR